MWSVSVTTGRTVTVAHSSAVGGGTAAAPSGRQGPVCARVRTPSFFMKHCPSTSMMSYLLPMAVPGDRQSDTP